ncbi:MAG: hypothetical protein WBP45_12235 [Daejeonella sp.]
MTKIKLIFLSFFLSIILFIYSCSNSTNNTSESNKKHESHTYLKTNNYFLDSLLKSPHISSDNKKVMFFTGASVEPGIGASKYRLIIKEVLTDHIIFEKTLISESESDSLHLDSISEIHLLRERFNKLESYVNPSIKWLPMLHASLAEPEVKPIDCIIYQVHSKRAISIDKLKFIYQEPLLKIVENNKQTFSQQFKNWEVKKDCCDKPNPSWLKSISVSPDHKIALVEIDFCGSCGCTEPPSEFHAVYINQKQR